MCYQAESSDLNEFEAVSNLFFDIEIRAEEISLLTYCFQNIYKDYQSRREFDGEDVRVPLFVYSKIIEEINNFTSLDQSISPVTYQINLNLLELHYFRSALEICRDIFRFEQQFKQSLVLRNIIYRTMPYYHKYINHYENFTDLPVDDKLNILSKLSQQK